MSKQTITINGVTYDSQTGLPIGGEPRRSASSSQTFTPIPKVHPSQAVHRTVEKSHTLRRHIVKKTAVQSPQKATAKPTISRSPAITKFAPHVAVTAKPVRHTDVKAKRMSDIGPMTHPIAAKAVARQAASVASPKPLAPKPSHIIKQEAIAAAMAKTPSHRAPDHKAPRKKSRAFSVVTASLALVLLGGYFTYLNMPNLSVRVAAVQAGINATYPGYHPEGYSIHGPVAYSPNGVSMKFAANGGPQSYTVDQAKSTLDSSAVLEDYVKPKAGGSYIPYSQQGLTIYIYGNNAAWVNGGILYTINGDAPLSSDQILHIASSM